jgi:hypothetical protein
MPPVLSTRALRELFPETPLQRNDHLSASSMMPKSG